MKVRALKNLIYRGQIHEEGDTFEIKENEAAALEKKVAKVEELPPLEVKRKK